MKITLSHAGVIHADIPHGDDLARYAVEAYHFVLNTPSRIGKEHSGPDFADAIGEVYDCTGGTNKAVFAHCTALK